MKAWGLGGIAACAALLDEEMTILGLEGPDGPPRDFCHGLIAKGPEDLIERRGDRRQRHQLHHGRIAQGERLARDHQRAGLIPERLGHHVAVNLHELLRVDREGLFEVAKNIVARRQGPLDELIVGLHRLKPAFQQALACRDHLDDAGVARREVIFDGADDGRGLHAHQEMVEEALLGAFKPGLGRGARGRRIGLPRGIVDASRSQCRFQIVVDRPKRACIAS